MCKKFIKAVGSKMLPVAVMMMAAVAFASCGSDDDDPAPIEDEETVNTASIVGKWCETKDVLLWSETDFDRDDETVIYAGGHAPYYRFWQFTKTDDGVFTMVRLGDTKPHAPITSTARTYTISDNVLKEVVSGEKAGVIEKCDGDDLVIKWQTHLNPDGADCPVRISYIDGNGWIN